MENAIKFTPSEGTVIITAIQDGDNVELSVTDNGIGISEENIDRIFYPFFQVDSSTTRIYGGTGLGLALIKKFIVMHGAIYGLRANLVREAHSLLPFQYKGQFSYFVKDLNDFDT